MVRSRRPARLILLLACILTVSTIYYFNKPTSSLSEDANPDTAKDAHGNTKTPDLSPGVGAVIDTHRVATHKSMTFPAKIHQTARKDTITPATLSWYYANPGEEHVFYSDKDAKKLVLQHVDAETSRLYNQLVDPVAKADLFRYIVLRYEGGVYSDIDTTTLCPINAWIPAEFDESKLGLVVGIEVDEPSVTLPKDLQKWGWASNFQFVQWTIMAKPGHKALDMVIQEVKDRLATLSTEKDISISAMQMTGLEIIRATGPGAFTAGLLKYLDLEDPSTLRGLTRPKQVKDVLIMPVTAFAPNQRHSHSKSVKYLENIPEVLVMHGFQATRSWADEVKIWLYSAAARARNSR